MKENCLDHVQGVSNMPTFRLPSPPSAELNYGLSSFNRQLHASLSLLTSSFPSSLSSDAPQPCSFYQKGIRPPAQRDA